MQKDSESHLRASLKLNPESDWFWEQEITKAIVISDAFQIGDFVFSSGEKAPMKIIVEELLKYKSYADLATNGLANMIAINKMRFNKICGVITGGAKLANLLEEKLAVEVITRMGKDQSPEKQKLIRGKIEKGDQLLYIEDMVTSAENSEICINQTRREGAIGTDLLALFTYGTRVSSLRLQKLGIIPYFATNVEVVLESAKGLGTINEQKFEELINWKRNQLDPDLLAKYR